jgi:hypothetical protein
LAAWSLLGGAIEGHRRRSPLRTEAVGAIKTPVRAVGTKGAIVGVCRRSFVRAVVFGKLASSVSEILPFPVPEVVVTIKVCAGKTNNQYHGDISR